MTRTHEASPAGLLDGRVAVVTGAAGGIGAASARALAAAGARVGLIDLDEQAAAAVCADLPVEAVAVGCDVSDEDQIAAALGRIAGRLGPVTVLHNNAGVLLNHGRGDGMVHELTSAGWLRTMAVNLNSAFFASRCVLPGMMSEGIGSIVSTASIGGTSFGTDNAAYCASKAGITGLTRALAVQYGPYGIRANAICPGSVRTAMSELAQADPAAQELFLRGVPARRLGEPEDVANLVVFLASELSSFMTGAVVTADGGVTITGAPPPSDLAGPRAHRPLPPAADK